MEVAKPIIARIIQDTKKGVSEFKNDLNRNYKDKEIDLINNYPTVYIHNWEKDNKFEVYVGESNDFFQRTEQHHELINDKNLWQHNLNENASLYVIAHEDFNKSLTLDIENRLIHYLSSSSSIAKVHNARGNPQNKYFPCEELDPIFSKIWKQLRTYDKRLFLSESEIKDSAIYKASSLHKLNSEQLKAKEKILEKISVCLLKKDENQLIFVQGNAGTGKTVLMGSIFYDLLNRKEYNLENNDIKLEDIDTAIIVNHNEQFTVYDEIIKKLDLGKNNEEIVFKPTKFINQFKEKKNSPIKRTKKYDVVFVDEAHLLLTQKNQAYTEENSQLTEIMKYAKIVVVMFDRMQMMNAEQYLANETIESFINKAKDNDSFIELNIQMRMRANEEIITWLKKIYADGILEKAPKHKGKYEIKVFDNPKDLEKAIKKKAETKSTSLSRLVATYDWKYSGVSRPTDKKYWNVTIDDWSMPWNYELLNELDSKYKKTIKKLSWAEQPHTINEIGSIYTIQGFDLNYVGVIIGPSIKYRNGKVLFDTSSSFNEKAMHKRTLADGTKKSFGEDFLKNELGVLLTRGVNGLYIYAYDDELRDQLKKVI